MFNVVTGRRKRSAWTGRAVAASVAAHLLLLMAAFAPAPQRPHGCDLFCESPPPPIPFPIGDAKVTPPAPERVTPPAAPREHRLSMGGPAPVATDGPPWPFAMATEDPRFTRSDSQAADRSGGGATEPSTPDPQPSAREPEAAPDSCDPCDDFTVTVLPHLSNEREARRLLQRLYPPLLRDAGVSGRTTVVLVIDRDGNVEPGSVRVQDTTHPAFEEAARRAAERFHFTPAQLNGRAVSVIIALPIEWQLQN